MWIVTDQGFFSFVVDRKDPTVLHLRARLREDLERNFPDADVYEKPGSDYLFRARVSKADVAARMTEMIMAADITGHFKDVALTRSAQPKFGSRRSAYYGLWTALAAMQPYAPYSKTPRPEPLPRKVVAQPKLSRPGDHGKPAYGGSFDGAYTYGGDVTRRAGDYDWDTHPQSASFTDPWGDNWLDTPPMSSQDFTDEDWAALTDAERDAILDEEELRAEQADNRLTAARLGAVDVPLFDQHEGAYPAPRASTRRERREARRRGRKNRHNQKG